MNYQDIPFYLFIFSQILLACLGIKDVIFKAEMKLWKKILVGITVLIMVIFSILYQNIQQTIDRNNIDAFQKDIIRVESARQMDSQDLDELITLKYKEIFNSNSADAEKWANQFIKSLPEEKLEAVNLSVNSEELANKLRLRWKPLYMYILQQFDIRIETLVKNGIKIQYEKNDFDIVNANPNADYTGMIRNAKFENGSEILVNLIPANVENGLLNQYPAVTVHKRINNGYQQIAAINFEKDGFSLSNLTMPYKDFECRTTNDPLEDKDFLNKINGFINNIITSMVIEQGK